MYFLINFTAKAKIDFMIIEYIDMMIPALQIELNKKP